MSTTAHAGAAPVVVLSIEDLDVRFATEHGPVHAVRGLWLDVRAGEVVALVGESGSGKSVTALAALGLLPRTAQVTGRVRVGSQDVTGRDARGLRRVRGSQIAMVFQDPAAALDPVLTVGDQLVEGIELHDVAHGRAAWARATDLLAEVGIDDPVRRMRQHPHELSGGECQRVVIAMAISAGPAVVVADEPTTALDVTVQAEILDLLRSLTTRLGTAIVLITHNMGVVADLADRVVVLHDGRVVERGTAQQVLTAPADPYTRRLVGAVPRLGAGPARPSGGPAASRTAGGADEPPVLVVDHLVVEYPGRGRAAWRAVDEVSLVVRSGEVVGLVGESGSGKSTVARCALGLLPATAGTVSLFGEPLAGADRRTLRRLRSATGLVLQDPAASLDPRMPVWRCIAEPLVIHGGGSRRSRQDRVLELLDAVELPERLADRYPHELSGGERQRVSIARALALGPRLLVADEPTSALDVSVQATVLALLADLQDRYGFAVLFISHDLAVVDMLAHRVVVLRAGRVVEQGPRAEVLRAPRDEYTRRLLAAAPVADPAEQRRRRVARRALPAAPTGGEPPRGRVTSW